MNQLFNKQVVVRSTADVNLAIADVKELKIVSRIKNQMQYADPSEPEIHRDLPDWANDKVDFWQLVGEMIAAGWDVAVGIDPESGPYCIFHRPDNSEGGYIQANNPALAACVAYLAMHGVILRSEEIIEPICADPRKFSLN